MGIEFRWWGFILHLDRKTACWAASSHPEYERYLDNIPQPWQTFVRGGIAAYKWLMAVVMGSEGIDIHFNWFGFVHWIGTRGVLQPC